MKAKSVTGGLVIVLSAITMMAFQNCSKVGTGVVGSDQLEGKASAQGQQDPAINTPDDSSGSLNANNSSDTTAGNDGSSDTSKNGDTSKSGSNSSASNSGDGSNPSQTPGIDQDIADGTAACKSKDGMPLSDLASIEDLRGSFVFNAVSSVKDVNNVGGKLVIIGQGQGSRIESVSNFGGKLVICNMNVVSIEHTNGVIVLVNSTVGNVVDHRGQIKTVSN